MSGISGKFFNYCSCNFPIILSLFYNIVSHFSLTLYFIKMYIPVIIWIFYYNYEISGFIDPLTCLLVMITVPSL